MAARAIARQIGTSPKKLRRIVDTVRGKGVAEAIVILQHLTSPHARMVAKVVKSAAANAENNYEMDPDRLVITGIWADPGPTAKRMRARPRGRASTILKRSSHIAVEVDEK